MTADGNDYRALYLAQGGRCFYCQRPMPPNKARFQHPSAGWTVDHFYPRANGHDKNNNVVLSCPPCNQTKADRLPKGREKDWFASLSERYARVRAAAEGR